MNAEHANVTLVDRVENREIEATICEMTAETTIEHALTATLICGDTYERRDELKAAGCWFVRMGRDAYWLPESTKRKAIYAMVKRCSEWGGFPMFF